MYKCFVYVIFVVTLHTFMFYLFFFLRLGSREEQETRGHPAVTLARRRLPVTPIHSFVIFPFITRENNFDDKEEQEAEEGPRRRGACCSCERRAFEATKNHHSRTAADTRHRFWYLSLRCFCCHIYSSSFFLLILKQNTCLILGCNFALVS